MVRKRLEVTNQTVSPIHRREEISLQRWYGTEKLTAAPLYQKALGLGTHPPFFVLLRPDSLLVRVRCWEHNSLEVTPLVFVVDLEQVQYRFSAPVLKHSR
jgi:hypothetical protein